MYPRCKERKDIHLLITVDFAKYVDMIDVSIPNLEAKDMKVKFHETVDDKLLKFAVIISKHNGKWVFCKHKERNTYEIPGGHREPNEPILETAKRELSEETGAL